MIGELTIFMVEDDDVDVLSMMRSLKQERIGNQVVRARDGLEALEMLREQRVPHPFIVLLDINMPRMNGLEFLAAVRADDNLKDTTVFVLTTSESESDVKESYLNHAAGYFVKKEVGAGFRDIVRLLDSYWKVVCLPE